VLSVSWRAGTFQAERVNEMHAFPCLREYKRSKFGVLSPCRQLFLERVPVNQRVFNWVFAFMCVCGGGVDGLVDGWEVNGVRVM